MFTDTFMIVRKNLSKKTSCANRRPTKTYYLGVDMFNKNHNQKDQFSDSEVLLEEIFQEQEKNFYDILGDFKFHLSELDKLLSDLKKQRKL